MVNMDFEINHLPPDQVDYGHEFLIELGKSKLSDTQKSKIKILCFAFLKAVVKAVLKRMPPALDLLLQLKFLSPVICLSQFLPQFGDLPLRIVPITDLSTLESHWRKLLDINWSFVCGV
jgi:hypothetical protein